jgi:hypothetical protein
VTEGFLGRRCPHFQTKLQERYRASSLFISSSAISLFCRSRSSRHHDGVCQRVISDHLSTFVTHVVELPLLPRDHHRSRYQALCDLPDPPSLGLLGGEWWMHGLWLRQCPAGRAEAWNQRGLRFSQRSAIATASSAHWGSAASASANSKRRKVFRCFPS